MHKARRLRRLKSRELGSQKLKVEGLRSLHFYFKKDGERKMIEILKKEEGQALVEFALVLPLLLLLVCGIIDFGWLFYNQLSLQNACREGARYACVHSTEIEIADKVNNKIKENLPGNLQDASGGLKSTVRYTNTAIPAEGDVTVEATAKLQFLTPVLSTIYQSTETTMKSSVTMKVES